VQTRTRNEGKGRKEGRKGRKGREEEGKERVCGAVRRGADLRCGWMDASMDREEVKRASGGREGRGTGKIRRGKGKKWLEFVLLIAHGEG
jgi:hypothetical protein